MKKIALVLLVIGILAVSAVGVMGASQFAASQEWNIYTGGGVYVCSYNYTTQVIGWDNFPTATGNVVVTYDKPDPGAWMGFWTYDATAAVYTEGVYILIESF